MMIIVKGINGIKSQRFKNKEKEKVGITLYEEEKITHLFSRRAYLITAL
jgi:hypothetical protein